VSKRNSQRSQTAGAETFDVQVKGFLEMLPTMGYTPSTRHGKRWLVMRFVRWAQGVGFEVADLDEVCASTFLVSRGGEPRKMERATLQQFVDYLRTIGVVPPRTASEPSAAEVMLLRYSEHLRNDRGLCDRSVEVYTPLVRSFLEAQQLPEDLPSLDASAVRAYLVDRSRNRSGSFVKLLAASLRSFLRFLFFDGVTDIDLSKAVPPIRQWRLANVPSFLTPEEIEQVLAATDRSTKSGCRAYAMLLLLARLGLRPGEVATLGLDDLRWDVGEIVVRGKGRLNVPLPLLDDVGEALELYLLEVRGKSSSRRVFLRLCAPHVGLSGPTAVCLVARQALQRAGVMPAGRVGAHIFRHSLATRMLGHGAALGEIAQVLRHRTIETTQLYAKVDFESLSGVALPWPSTEVHQ